MGDLLMFPRPKRVPRTSPPPDWESHFQAAIRLYAEEAREAERIASRKALPSYSRHALRALRLRKRERESRPGAQFLRLAEFYLEQERRTPRKDED